MQKENDHKPSQTLLEVLETEILEYGRSNNIQNPYWYFSSILNYKSKNTLYDWFRAAGTKKIGYGDLWTVIRVTHSRRLIDAIIQDITEAIQ